MNNPSQPIVLVGIVLYNPDLLELQRCLHSIKYQSLAPECIKLAIRDNNQGNSEQAVRRLLQEEGLAEQLIIWENGDNIGFGSAHNRLFKAAQGTTFTHYLCVNPDSILHFDCIANLTSFAIQAKNAGIFEAKQFPLEHPKPYDTQTGETAWCSGCTLMLPYEVYEKTGGYDENLFLYCEDVDLSWHVRSLGLKCYLVPSALVSHYVFSKNRNPENERKHMLLSGYKLAHKYRHTAFKRGVLDELKKFMPPQELAEQITDLPTPVASQIAKQFEGDFAYGFHFAPARW